LICGVLWNLTHLMYCTSRWEQRDRERERERERESKIRFRSIIFKLIQFLWLRVRRTDIGSAGVDPLLCCEKVNFLFSSEWPHSLIRHQPVNSPSILDTLTAFPMLSDSTSRKQLRFLINPQHSTPTAGNVSICHAFSHPSVFKLDVHHVLLRETLPKKKFSRTSRLQEVINATFDWRHLPVLEVIFTEVLAVF
jgi:hypothetical protein